MSWPWFSIVNCNVKNYLPRQRFPLRLLALAPPATDFSQWGNVQKIAAVTGVVGGAA
jgi:hypothetical protein